MSVSVSENSRLPDIDAIQGLWRVISTIRQGRPILSGVTHYQFAGNRVKAIQPHRVEGGDWSQFELGSQAQPKRFTKVWEWVGKDGTRNRRIDRCLYELEGDTLKLCWPNVFGQYPDTVSDQIHTVETLTRDLGPLPETKRPSGKKPIDDAVLGQLTWDDNYDHWTAIREITPGHLVEISLEPEGADLGVFLEQCHFLFERILRDELEMRRRAGLDELLELYNETWTQEEETITLDMFASRIKLESISFREDGKAELWYSDGDMFGGHAILIRLDTNGEFNSAGIEG